MSQKARHGAGESAPSAPSFEPVSLRYRHDGWTPERQVGFIRALAECGCVRDACRRVGMSAESAYELARRPDAQSFRVAWQLALDNAVRRISDEAFSRCIHGVAVPHYFRGELIGEHRRYDERLTMFILRYRDPHRYGKHLDRCEAGGHPEEPALQLGAALHWVESDARREAAGLPRHVQSDLDSGEEGAEAPPIPRATLFRWAPGGAAAAARADAQTDADDWDEECLPPDVPRASSTSGPPGSHDPRSANPPDNAPSPL